VHADCGGMNQGRLRQHLCTIQHRHGTVRTTQWGI
jgi:hypothetical protein